MIDLKGGGPEENAQKFKAVLEGGSHTDPKRDSIVLNAGVGCYVYGKTESIEAGCELARKTLESGKAAELLKKWISTSQRIAKEYNRQQNACGWLYTTVRSRCRRIFVLF